MMSTTVQFYLFSLYNFHIILETFINNLLNYEENNLEFYAEGDLEQRLVTHSSQDDLKNKIKSTVNIKAFYHIIIQHEGWVNPYSDMINWIKAEEMDILSLQEAI